MAPKLLAGPFEVDTPDTAYVGDMTYICTEEGWLYLAVVVDLFRIEGLPFGHGDF